MTLSAVLDAGAFDVIDTAEGAQLRHLLRSVPDRGGDVRCAAVTLAEVCRGPARTRRVEVAVARDRGGQRVLVVATDDCQVAGRRPRSGRRAATPTHGSIGSEAASGSKQFRLWTITSGFDWRRWATR